MSAVDYRHFQSGWQYAWLTLLNRLGYPPSDREIASFLANDPDALMLAALNGSHETTASILQLRLIQLGLDSPRAGIAVLARPKSRGRPVASMPGVLSSCWRCRVDPRRGDLTLQKRLAANTRPPKPAISADVPMTPPRPNGSRATRPPVCAPSSTPAGSGACAAGCAGRWGGGGAELALLAERIARKEADRLRTQLEGRQWSLWRRLRWALRRRR